YVEAGFLPPASDFAGVFGWKGVARAFVERFGRPPVEFEEVPISVHFSVLLQDNAVFGHRLPVNDRQFDPGGVVNELLGRPLARELDLE
ncbi:hypothetical protein Q8G41_27895, partial [Klebsiella pneumoniae]|uniref:hypothetical protein n=1 Tax=Klebsiella pneumoniae TaxID=573 RepID=UPI003013BFB5